MIPDEREVAMCSHWLLHRLAARGLTAFSEATLLVDEWIGRPSSEALAAIQRGDDDLTEWCPELREYWASVTNPTTS